MDITFQSTEKRLEKFVLVKFAGEDWQDQLADRRHDLANAMSTLKVANKLLQNGYRFDDDNAVKRIKAIQEAILKITQEMDQIVVPLIDS